MANGILYSEGTIQATNIDALNRDAKHATANVDGGNLVILTASTTDGNNVYTATTPATGSLTGLWVAYNPSEHLTVVNGKTFAGLSQDPRDYTNITGRTFVAFKPKVGDKFEVTAECVDEGTRASVVAGDFIEAKNGQTTWTRKTSSPTASTTAAKVIAVANRPFPAEVGHVGYSKQKVFTVELVQE